MPRDKARAELGQWFTPEAVADLALGLASGGRTDLRVLDPTCGDGVFLRRALTMGFAPADLAGVEIDEETARAARARLPGVAITSADLFSLPPDALMADAVVGNPPYVRRERVGALQRETIRRRLAEDWPELSDGELAKLLGRGDLAAACLARALRLVRPEGKIAMVVSSALLEARYAQPLWRLVERVGRVAAIVDSPDERWFESAAVNAVIVVIEAQRASGGPLLARLSRPVAEIASRVRGLGDLRAAAEVRSGTPRKPERWGAELRAPAIWGELEAVAGSALVPLGSVAEVIRGSTSGANAFFYMSRAEAAARHLEKDLLEPLLRSPRAGNAAFIAADPERCDTLALVIPAEVDFGSYPAAAAYIAAEGHAWAERPSLRARRPWWSLRARPASLFLTKSYAARFVQPLASRPMLADQRYYGLHPRPGIRALDLAAVLNSSYTALALESLGRASLGEGALEWTVGDAASLPIFDPRRPGLGAALQPLLCRQTGAVEAEAGAPDRRALDAAVAPEALPLLDRVHAALIFSTRRRAARAESRGRARR